MKYFTSDWHLGDPRIGLDEFPNLLYRPFTSLEQQTATVFENLLKSGIGPGDTLFHLGDVFYRTAYQDLQAFDYIKYKLDGVKMVLIKGNYDEDINPYILNKYFDEIYDITIVDINGQDFYLNHYPEKCLHSTIPCLTGHIHGLWKVQKNMINVGVDAWHFRPVSEDQIAFCYNAMTKYYDKNVFPYPT